MVAVGSWEFASKGFIWLQLVREALQLKSTVTGSLEPVKAQGPAHSKVISHTTPPTASVVLSGAGGHSLSRVGPLFLLEALFQPPTGQGLEVLRHPHRACPSRGMRPVLEHSFLEVLYSPESFGQGQRCIRGTPRLSTKAVLPSWGPYPPEKTGLGGKATGIIAVHYDDWLLEGVTE